KLRLEQNPLKSLAVIVIPNPTPAKTFADIRTLGVKKMRSASARFLLVVAVVLSSLPAPAQTQRRRAPAAGQRAQSDIERKIDALLARMTLEEKLGQLQQL